MDEREQGATPLTDPRHFCPNARMDSAESRLCCDVCVPLCEICGVKLERITKPIARLTKPETFLQAETGTDWQTWKHLVWVIPAVGAVLSLCLYLWIVFIAWAIKLADAWGWLP